MVQLESEMPKEWSAGFIVFWRDLTLLVENTKGRKSFPKGHHEGCETLKECAFRELREETGLCPRDVAVIPGVQIRDTTGKNKDPLFYMVAKLCSSESPTFNFNPREIRSVGWYSIEDALKEPALESKRKKILRQAYISFVKNSAADS